MMTNRELCDLVVNTENILDMVLCACVRDYLVNLANGAGASLLTRTVRPSADDLAL